MHTEFIKSTELLNKAHEPVMIAFFDVGTENFPSFIESLCSDIGWSGNFSSCYSWASLDDYEQSVTKKYDGILFETIDGQEAVISYKQLYYYIKTACTRYVQMYPNHTGRMNALLRKFKQHYVNS